MMEVYDESIRRKGQMKASEGVRGKIQKEGSCGLWKHQREVSKGQWELSEGNAESHRDLGGAQ